MRLRSVATLIAASLGCILPINISAQQPVFALANDVSFTILPTQRAYKIGE